MQVWIWIWIVALGLLVASQLVSWATEKRPATTCEGMANEGEQTQTHTEGEGEGEEGNKYQPYNLASPNNALILAQQNAGNIEFLRGRVASVEKLDGRVSTMEQVVSAMQTQMEGLVQQQANAAQQLAGSEAPVISGTDMTPVAEEGDG